MNDAVPRTRSPTVRGGLERGEVEREIRRHLRAVRHCYERVLLFAPNPGGKVVVTWRITASGDTRDATVAGTAHDLVQRCVARVFSRMRFPAPRGGGEVSVAYPIVFSRAGR